MATPIITCSQKALPDDLQQAAVAEAIRANPANAPPSSVLAAMVALLGVSQEQEAEAEAQGIEPPLAVLEPWHLAVMVGRYWGAGGVKLTVGFMEPCPVDLRNRILSHMNAWSEYCNVRFAWTQTSPQVRISRGKGGYWSYLGTDVSQIPRGKQTMNLEGFTMNTPESEFVRVVRHETGHTLGFPHEHMRRELVALLDEQKTIAYFMRTQGWSAQEVRAQVLTPLDQSSIRGTPNADADSIMCYQIPGECTKSGAPIPGGLDIDAIDQEYAAGLYPLAAQPPPIPGSPAHLVVLDAHGTVLGKWAVKKES